MQSNNFFLIKFEKLSKFHYRIKTIKYEYICIFKLLNLLNFINLSNC